MHSSVPAVSVSELAGVLADDPTTPLIDVREPAEYAAGHAPSAVLIPMSVVPVRLADIPKDRTVYVICHSGGRSAQVVHWLNAQGYDTVNVEGGTAAWGGHGHPIA